MRTPATRSRHHRDRELGQSFVEFALVFPVLLLILLAAIDFGRIYLGWVNLQSASGTAANFAANNASAWYPPDDVSKQNTRSRYQALVKQDAAKINCTLPGTVPDPVFEGDTLGSPVTVDLVCLFDPLTPLIDIVTSDQVQVGAVAVSAVKDGGTDGSVGGTPIPPPGASFVASPSSGYGPLTVEFIDTSTGSPTSWVWTFSDGQSSIEKSPSITFDLDAGAATTYEATLRACNSGGCSDSSPVTISVEPPPTTGPIPAFSADPRSGEAPLTVTFTDASTSALPITSWTWDFGDGTPLVTGANPPPHTYQNVDVYDVTLEVSDGTTTNSLTLTTYINVTPVVCTVPNFAAIRKNDAQDLWEDEGFTTDVQFRPGNGNYIIQYQSIPGLTDNPPGGCDATITVGP
jgi:PKD repeat protein